MAKRFSYKQSGVDIDLADATKQAMKRALEPADPRVLNRLGPFASLFEASFPGVEHPVLVLKTEEPGSKQKLALEHGRAASLAYDLINHLVNDIVVMGAQPLAVQDAIICGRLDKEVVSGLVAAMAEACRAQGCSLVGGETSEQPGVIGPGIYILTASIVGVVDRSRIIDGSRIRKGDRVLALASNGLHTNGYSLVRALMAERPRIVEADVDGQPFLEAILRPHTCYYEALREVLAAPELHGLAHVTGGGIRDNLRRVLPEHLSAVIELERVRVLPVFRVIRQAGSVPEADMLRTFNLGVGMIAVADPGGAPGLIEHLAARGCETYEIGEIVDGEADVIFRGSLSW